MKQAGVSARYDRTLGCKWTEQKLLPRRQDRQTESPRYARVQSFRLLVMRPKKKEQRAAARQEKKEQKEEKSETKSVDNDLKTKHSTPEKPKSARFISVKTKRNVVLAAKCRCSYVSQNGRRCSSTSSLKVDHISPFGFGGSNETANLRILCQKHNLH